MKVVIDTNVLISGLLFGGIPGRLIPLWKGRRIQPLASKEIIDEYLRVLAYPRFQLSPEEIEYLLFHEVLPWFEIIEVPPGRSFIVEDPSDEKFIWCAEAGGADFIISGDQHLLNFRHQKIKVLSPTDFLDPD